MHIFNLVQGQTPDFQLTIAEETPDLVTVNVAFLYYLELFTHHDPADFSGNAYVEISDASQYVSQEFSQLNDLTISFSVNLIPGITYGGFMNFSDDNHAVSLDYSFDLTVLSAGTRYYSGTNDFNVVIGSNLADGMQGMSGDDGLNGRGGNDTLDGGSGEDRLYGGAGNDTLIGGTGNDSLFGGLGIDTAAYWGAIGAIKVDLQLTGNQDIGGGQGTDMLHSIENVIGSGFADMIIGNAGANLLEGGAGNDTLVGMGGNDVLNGGAGGDTAGYGHATGGVRVDLRLTGAQPIGGGQGSDRLISIENLNGSRYADRLTGDNGANILNGGGGNDTLIGLGGNDVLNGGAGLDTSAYGQATGGVRVDLQQTGLQSIGGGQGSDQLISIENLDGSRFADRLTGNNAANVLNGGAGNDTLVGLGGNDVLNGGAGVDTASYTQASGGVTVNLGLSVAQTIGGGQGADRLVSIENLDGSQFADRLTGNGAANLLSGGAGNDVLMGMGGNDVLIGGRGADRLTGGNGADAFVFRALADSTVGPAGRDTIVDFRRAQGDVIDLGAIDAIAGTARDDAFLFIGQAEFSGRSGQLRFQLTTEGTLISGDVNGDRRADFAILLQDRVILLADDFML